MNKNVFFIIMLVIVIGLVYFYKNKTTGKTLFSNQPQNNFPIKDQPEWDKLMRTKEPPKEEPKEKVLPKKEQELPEIPQQGRPLPQQPFPQQPQGQPQPCPPQGFPPQQFPPRG